jgi:hypothetical protein
MKAWINLALKLVMKLALTNTFTTQTLRSMKVTNDIIALEK